MRATLFVILSICALYASGDDYFREKDWDHVIDWMGSYGEFQSVVIEEKHEHIIDFGVEFLKKRWPNAELEFKSLEVQKVLLRQFNGRFFYDMRGHLGWNLLMHFQVQRDIDLFNVSINAFRAHDARLFATQYNFDLISSAEGSVQTEQLFGQSQEFGVAREGGEVPIVDEGVVHIMTYNIWNFNPEWEVRKAMLVEQIKNEKPDIVGIQEVRFQSTQNAASKHQMSELAELLPEYQFYYTPSMTYFSDGGHIDEGCGVLSRWPIVDTGVQRLTRNFSDVVDEHARSIVKATVRSPYGPIEVFVTHSSLSNTARARNAVEKWDFMQKTAKKQPQILMGDLNEEPNDVAVDFLIGRRELSGRTGNFKDAWVEQHGTDKDKEGWTYTTLQQEPKKRIDFILYRGDHFNLKSVSVLQNGDVKQQPSDHRAVSAWFKYNKDVDHAE